MGCRGKRHEKRSWIPPRAPSPRRRRWTRRHRVRHHGCMGTMRADIRRRCWRWRATSDGAGRRDDPLFPPVTPATPAAPRREAGASHRLAWTRNSRRVGVRPHRTPIRDPPRRCRCIVRIRRRRHRTPPSPHRMANTSGIGPARRS